MPFNSDYLKYGYEINVHPDVEPNKNEPKVNCAWIALKVIRDNLNIDLVSGYPGRYSIIELINDEQNFKTIKFSPNNLSKHDIVVFQTRYRASRNMHIGIFMGEEKEKDPLILHSSYTTKGVVYESLGQICKYRTPKYNNQRFVPIYTKKLIYL